MLLHGLQLFSATVGLKANKGKSPAYSCGMQQADDANIFKMFGFDIGSLPFKYLVIPVSENWKELEYC